MTGASPVTMILTTTTWQSHASPCIGVTGLAPIGVNVRVEWGPRHPLVNALARRKTGFRVTLTHMGLAPIMPLVRPIHDLHGLQWACPCYAPLEGLCDSTHSAII